MWEGIPWAVPGLWQFRQRRILWRMQVQGVSQGPIPVLSVICKYYQIKVVIGAVAALFMVQTRGPRVLEQGEGVYPINPTWSC